MSGTKSADVEYIIRADDSQIEADTERANKKIEKATKSTADKTVKIEKEKTQDVKKEVKKIEDANENAAKDSKTSWKKSAEEIEDAFKKSSDDTKKETKDTGNVFKNVSGVIKDSLSDAATGSIPLLDQLDALTAGLSGAQMAAVGIGAVFAGAAVAGVAVVSDFDTAMNDFIASTGKGVEETERYQNVLEEIYANNYGEDFQDISDAMELVVKNLGDMDDAALQEVTESAFVLRDTFEYDLAESTRAAKALMDNFGISGEEAMSMIAAGAQNGLDYSGELLDSISEYSVQFEKVGFSADDMFKIFQKGTESGAFNLDKVGDAIKEFSIRAVDGSDTTKKAFDDLGFEDLTEEFAAGGERAQNAFETILYELDGMQDKVKQNEIGVALFGTMWEDLGADAVTALVDIQEGSYDTADAMNQIKEVKYDDIGSMLEELKRNVELLVVPIGEALIPLLLTLITAVLPVVSELLGPIADLFSALLAPIVSVISAGIQPLIDILNFLISNAIQPLINVVSAVLLPIFTGALDGMLSSAFGIIRNITNIFSNLISFIKNVFTGNWRGAWENVKSIFSNAVEALVGIFKAPINAIVDGWNKLAGSIGSVTVPEWVPIVGGKSFSLPTMSRLKVGLDYVPNDMFPAYLDEGEWVLTKEEANLLRSIGGIEGIMSIMAARTGNRNEIIVSGNDYSVDYDLIGEAVYDAFVRYGMEMKWNKRSLGRIVGEILEERGL